MTLLTDYQHFAGRHWETGSLHNALAYQAAHAPRPAQWGKPLSEAMLLGLSGGIAVGYFLFGYKGYPPQLALMTRNTFSPFDTILERLGAPQTLLQTANPAKAEANLLEVLDSGRPALVWADGLSLPYNGLGPAKDMWMMWPVVVYGYDGVTAWLADRSAQPLQVTAAELAAARGRVKKEKYRVLALELPDRAKLPAAIDQAMRQCIALYVDKPPRGTPDNFGLAALQHWAAMLTNTRNPKSWARFFPAGAGLWAAVIGAGWSPGLVGWIEGWGGPGADRGQYADFLDEAAALTRRPGLKPAA
ncbi:MAG: BtrH N-terminal domain-containing protein, partial [Anaerolineales bacterium]